MKCDSECEGAKNPATKAPLRFKRGVRAILVAATLVPSVAVPQIVIAATDSADPQYTIERTQIGIASWYGRREAGHRTASGAIFDPGLKTAAHRTLPLGSCVRVTHLGNGRFVTVPIIDRGPYIRGRLIDLSEAAALTLGMRRTGLARVRIDVKTTCLDEAQPRLKSALRTISLHNGERS
jgi:rare lipoprotein A